MPVRELEQFAGKAGFRIGGKVRKGGKKPGKNRFGADLDHFRIDALDPELQEEIDRIYGAKPARVEVFLPYASIEENFSYWKESWNTGGQLTHRCDGEYTVKLLKPDGRYDFEPKPCPGGCKMSGRLIVILSKLGRFTPFMLETHSRNDVLNILSCLDNTLPYSADGTLRGIPFVIERRQAQIKRKNEDGILLSLVKNLVFIEPEGAWMQGRLTSLSMASAGFGSFDPEVIGELPVAMDEDEDDEDDLVAADDTPSDFSAATARLDALGKKNLGSEWVEVRQARALDLSAGDTGSVADLGDDALAAFVQWIGTIDRINTLGTTAFPDWYKPKASEQYLKLTEGRTGHVWDLSEDELARVEKGLNTIIAKTNANLS